MNDDEIECFRRFADSLPPSFDKAVINLIDALKDYRPWLKEWADGVYNHQDDEWEIEPHEVAKEDLRKLDEMLSELKEIGLNPKLKA